MKLINRKDYLEKLISLRGTPDIKILTGIRRSGKSELLKAYINYLKKDNEDANIIYIDFYDLKFDNLKLYNNLYDYVEERWTENKENVLMIDEVQLCDKFELAINSFHNSKKYDIYITGSNAFLMSSDLATLFTGRYIELHIYPFSYKEYCEYFEINGTETDALDNYLIQGGLPGSYVYKDSQSKEYIHNVYNTIIKRDLVDKYKIGDLSIIESLSEFLMDNISNLTTSNKIANVLTSNKLSTNHVTIGNYIKYLCNAFMFYRVKRYDIKGKKYLETSDKYYLSDLSFRYSILGLRNMDYGRAYENIVAIELLRRNYDIYVGKLYDKEIDFVALKDGKKIYIQVSDNILDENTLIRELAPLKAIRDAYPKYIIANTKHPAYDIEGIEVIDIARWLLEQ